VEPGESDIAQRGRILVDWEIREYADKYGMIEPFENRLVREGVISYGLSSMGYDIRIADEFKIFTNINTNTTVVDPKHFDPRSLLPAKIYNNEGIAQVTFLESERDCEVSYADRGGKYQFQRGITIPRV
jgi:deoxycytidine triphosphate deaminase